MWKGEGNGRVGRKVAVGSNEVGHHEDGGGLGVWRESVVCVGTPGDSRNRHQSNMSRWPKDTRHAAGGVRVQRIGPQRSEVTGEGRGQEQCRKDPRWHDHPPKPQPQRSTQSQEAGEGSNEELKEKQNKVKINSSEHYESDYRRAE